MARPSCCRSKMVTEGRNAASRNPIIRHGAGLRWGRTEAAAVGPMETTECVHGAGRNVPAVRLCCAVPKPFCLHLKSFRHVRCDLGREKARQPRPTLGRWRENCIKSGGHPRHARHARQCGQKSEKEVTEKWSRDVGRSYYGNIQHSTPNVEGGRELTPRMDTNGHEWTRKWDF